MKIKIFTEIHEQSRHASLALMPTVLPVAYMLLLMQHDDDISPVLLRFFFFWNICHVHSMKPLAATFCLLSSWPKKNAPFQDTEHDVDGHCPVELCTRVVSEQLTF